MIYCVDFDINYHTQDHACQCSFLPFPSNKIQWLFKFYIPASKSWRNGKIKNGVKIKLHSVETGVPVGFD